MFRHGIDLMSDEYAWLEKWRPRKLSRRKRLHPSKCSKTHLKKSKMKSTRLIVKLTSNFIKEQISGVSFARRVFPVQEVRG